jgi:preprotein translocase subunit SecA
MFQKIVKFFGGDPHKREVARLSEIVKKINSLEGDFEKLSDEALKAKTVEFKARLAKGETLEDLTPEAFAVVREASKRTIGLRHYDVQMIGGMTLNSGKIAEMRTGEGKTLVATLPLYLNALTGKGVHLVTVNDYLARRDARWMTPIYQFLGLTVGVLQMAARTENGQKAFVVDLEKTSPHEDQHQLRLVSRAEAYQADIVYGTNSEFGFDYLRDNLTMSLEERSQRGHYFAIVDEVDNILIDEARTPLIISGPASDDTEWYVKMAQIVRQLQPEDYEVNEKDRAVSLTEQGEIHAEELLGLSLRDPDRPEDVTPEQARLMGHLEQAMRAQYLYRRNKDYLVQGGKVVIVDEFTGRQMPGRRWSEGLHQAVEAKEGVKVEPENVTYATITLQNYFRMYEKLAGMTGTALTESEEFYKIYKLDVLPIPTNLEYATMLPDATFTQVEDKDEQGYKRYYYARKDSPKRPAFWRRQDFPDQVYRSEEAKLRAITLEILRFFAVGRPQLVGTTSVEHSERLSDRLQAEPLRRLAQVMLIRQAWMDKNKVDMIEQAVPELKVLGTPIMDLDAGMLRPLARTYGISLNPEDPANLETLKRILYLSGSPEERIAQALAGGIPHAVLNARKHDEESQIIARAGAFGAVTIATNMAGRGVDIKLGGELPDEVLQDVIRVLHKAGIQNPYDMSNEERRQALTNVPADLYGIYEEPVKAFIKYLDDMALVRALGGLHVIGSERHESRRIDNQLRGRAARQGDPGSSRFYLSLEDDLMRLFGGAQVENLIKRFAFDDSIPFEMNLLGRLVEQSQERVEGQNFDVRKHLLEYDDVLNAQRKRIYTQRDRVFTKEDLSEDVLEMLRTELAKRIPEGLRDEEGPWKLLAYLDEIQPPIEYQDVYYPSYAYQLMIDEVRAKLNKGLQLQKALVETGEHALEMEREHMLRSLREALEKTEDTLEQQIQDRLEVLDNFMTSLKDGDMEEGAAARRPLDILTELIEMVHIPLKLSQEQLRVLPEGDKEVKQVLKEQIEVGLRNQFIGRMLVGIERRLGESLNIRANQLNGLEWRAFSDMMLNASNDIFDQRKERLFADQGQVWRDLENEINRLGQFELDDRRLLRLLRVMMNGSRTEFNTKTHRRENRNYNRLNYYFLCARLVSDTSSDRVAQTVLEHLEGARQALQKAWGKIEFQRLAQAEVTMRQFDAVVQKWFEEALGEARYAMAAERPLGELDEESSEKIGLILGRRLENEAYRYNLLRVISDQWVDYLTRIEALRVSIGLEAYAQKDPLVMYKSKATDMFQALLGEIRMGVISRMFTYRPSYATPIATYANDQAEENTTEEPGKTPQGTNQSQGQAKKRKRH